MDVRKIVVVVEDADAARTALRWALHNLLRHGDLITLLHVFPSLRSRNKNKIRLHRVKGFQLALSFKEICNNFPNSKIEIVVREGDQEGGTIARLVREIGASTLVVGLHDQSFLYKLAMAHNNIASNFNCKVLAIKPPTTPLTTRNTNIRLTMDSSTSMDFSHVEISDGLRNQEESWISSVISIHP
ncbi:adenine nucleotide alpha hydrolases-like superfamily protein [Actinidia rufa]|uniref:Adenine nucleotide alpha hydrolases-like superfamily protein n=1 Tax=Actinidia rufa TaxID=165716 RepID=A0A7J0DTA4_9ERIC|nr:adenine nucleotide alpha hydrolases-like superfamily protein [Actinidia rufa]